MLYNKTLLFIHPIYNGPDLLIPNSQSIPPAHSLPLDNRSIASLYSKCASVSQLSSLVSYFRFHF